MSRIVGFGNMLSPSTIPFSGLGKSIKRFRYDKGFTIIIPITKYLEENSDIMLKAERRFLPRKIPSATWIQFISNVEKGNRCIFDPNLNKYRKQANVKLAEYLTVLGVTDISQIFGLEEKVSGDFELPTNIEPLTLEVYERYKDKK